MLSSVKLFNVCTHYIVVFMCIMNYNLPVAYLERLLVQSQIYCSLLWPIVMCTRPCVLTNAVDKRMLCYVL